MFVLSSKNPCYKVHVFTISIRHAISSCYSKHKVEKKVVSLCKISEFYTTEFVYSYFHLCRSGYHHDRVDVDALAAATVDVDEDLMTLYLGYYE
jgi:hypothetical protein